MPAFQFPDPAVEQSVVNSLTGTKYIWKTTPGKWVVANSTIDLPDIPDQVTYQIQTDKILRDSAPAIELVDSAGFYSNVKFEATGGLSVISNQSAIIFDGSGIAVDGGDVNLDDYYTKDEIDQQFAMRGVGYNYVLSDITSIITIRPGEFTVNHRLAGQVNLISIGPEDEDGHEARVAVAGDVINLIDVATQIEYRYTVTAVADAGVYGVEYSDSVDKRDNAFGVGHPFIINIFPTHISAADYYTKVEANSKFLNKQGGTHTVFSTVKYRGEMTDPESLVTKTYVDTELAGIQVLLAAETSEPNVYYGDYAPTLDLQDGSMWFDSMNLRLNIFSQGAWVNPDRNDGADLEDRMSALEVRIAQLESN